MQKTEPKRVFIIGAGLAGRGIANELLAKPVLGITAAFLDDDSTKIGSSYEGVPVIGPIDAILKTLRAGAQDRAIIAMPSAERSRIQEIYRQLQACGFSSIHIVPAIAQIIEGKVHLVQTRTIDPLDILGRDPAGIRLKKSLDWLRNKRVLISGAGGSIGSELARQLLEAGVQRLYLMGHGENSIYQIDSELRRLQAAGVGERCAIVPLIGDLKNREWLFFIMQRLKCDAVFHAAAYKHVPMMEANTVAAIENNVFGTKNLLDACEAHAVQRFILISTDKAVDPLCIYGASKHLSEQLVLDFQKRQAKAGPALAAARYCFVRFGNVLGSRGSILPLFMTQVENGGPLTVTHPEASRYFMTIPEACSLVLKAGSLASSAPAFLLDMGPPIRIRDLAEQVIRFSGLEPDKDIAIEYIGLRPGERLHERLHSDSERLEPSGSQRINALYTTAGGIDMPRLLAELEPVCFLRAGKESSYRNRRRLRTILRQTIPGIEEKPDEPEY
ncbi:MAG: polysaccharide biosynthesis protein [Spirochaetes bacterium]|nr:polysaccharide biosynthesis protein [Spirochaetota bacterium]